MHRFPPALSFALFATLAPLLGCQSSAPVDAPDPAFLEDTLDVGIVVSDLDLSARFYGEVLGLRELEGFSVPASFCTDAGLTAGYPLTIRVFAAGSGESATKLKLMEVPGTNARRGNHKTIHDELGFSYLTLFVSDLPAAARRAEEAGFRVMGKGPVPIAGHPRGDLLALVPDPDGNLVELIGPPR